MLAGLSLLAPSACAKRIPDIRTIKESGFKAALEPMLTAPEQQSAVTQRVLPDLAVQEAQHTPLQTTPLFRVTSLLMTMLLKLTGV